MIHHLLLLPLVFTAVVTVRDDLREGRIYNRRVLHGLGTGAAAYGLLLLAEAGGMGMPVLVDEGWHWSAAVVIDLVMGLAVAILLWQLGVWAAGDAKLFAVYAFLVPPFCYTRSYLPGFPALPLLVNVFALVFVLLAADLIRTGVPALARLAADGPRRTQALGATPGALLKLLPIVLTFTAMFAGIRAVREASREGISFLVEVGDFTLFLVLFAVFRPLSRVILTRWGAAIFTLVSLACLAFLAQKNGFAGIPQLLLPSCLAVVLVIFARAYPALGRVNRRIDVGRLRPGMLPGKESLQLLRSREQRELSELGDEAPEHEEPNTTAVPTLLGAVTADGLTEEQVRFIRTRYNDDEVILVERTLPFSPVLAAAALVTYFFGGPLTALVLGR